jgi:hypothetical protein
VNSTIFLGKSTDVYSTLGLVLQRLLPVVRDRALIKDTVIYANVSSRIADPSDDSLLLLLLICYLFLNNIESSSCFETHVD